MTHSTRSRRGGGSGQPSVIPGFGLTLGFSLAYLTLIILIPLTGLVWRSAALGWADFFAIATDRRTLKALEISFGTAFIAALSTSSSAPSSPGCWCATAFPAAASSTPWSTCPSRCRRRSPASR